MAATVTVRHYTGSSGAPTLNDETGAASVFVTEDAHYASGTVNPIPIPSASSNYSYWQAHRLNATTAPSGTISNIKVYTDGTNSSPSGVTWKGNTATSYVQATGTPGTTGLQLTTGNYATLAGSGVDIFTWTSVAPKTVAGTLSGPSTGAFGDFVVIQSEVASTTTTTGETAGEVITFIYDET